MRLHDPLGTAATVLWVAGHFAAMTLLGVTVYEDTGSADSTAAEPDPPLTQPDPPLAPDAA